LRSSDTHTTHGIEPNGAAEQRSLRERKLLGYDGELILMDKRPFGKPSTPA